MNILDQFADDVTEIDIIFKNIKGILDFKRFTKLVKLNCTSNKITSLDNLPNSLIELNCYYNEITSLNNLVFEITKGTETFSKEKCIFKPNLLSKLKCDNTVKDYNKLMKKYNK